MAIEFDVVIAGGGVVGSACAYFLQCDSRFRGSIAVVEPDPTYRNAASARSASAIRQQFSTPVNIALSAYGIEFLRDVPRRLALADCRAAIGLVESTYLYLATEAGQSPLRHGVSMQRRSGVAVSLYDRSALAARYPWLHTVDLAAGSDTAAGEGWFDGYALLTALRNANRRGGVRYLRDRVLSLERSYGGEIAALTLEQQGRVACRYAVNATGTRSRDLASSAGIELPVYARKRCVFVFTCPTPISSCPLVVDPSGLWFRPERDRYLCGLPADPDPNVSPEDFDVPPDLFESRAWPILAHRVPAFAAIRLTGAWAGHYDYNVFDQNAFVGPVPSIPNLLLASGFSGHGLQQAPGIGRGIAEHIIGGHYQSLDLGPLSYARYLANAPLREVNII